MKLTPKQKAFARAVAEGNTLSDAYRKAYDAGRMSPAAIRTEASKLAANPAITQMILTLNERKDASVVASTVSDREKVLQKLRDLMDNAEGTPAEQVILKAADLLGRTQGMYQKKVEIDDRRDRSPDEIRRELAERLAALDESGTMH